MKMNSKEAAMIFITMALAMLVEKEALCYISLAT